MNNPVNYRSVIISLIVGLSALLIFLGTCSPQSEGTYDIVAGQSIGRFQLKQELEQSEVFNILGEADSTDAAACKSWSMWFLDQEDSSQKEFAVYAACDPAFDMRKSIKIMRLANADFVTKRGITNKSTLRDLQELLPNQTSIQNLRTAKDELVTLVDIESEGIAFEIVDTNITAVIVHEPGQKLTDAYLPFYVKN